MATTPPITAPGPRRSQRPTSGRCRCGPRLEDSPPVQEQGERKSRSRFPDKRVWQDYPLRPCVLPPNSHLSTFGFQRSQLLGTSSDLRKRTTVACAMLSRVRRGIERVDRSSIRGATEVFPLASQVSQCFSMGKTRTLGFKGSWLLGTSTDLRKRTTAACATLSRVRRGTERVDRSSIRGATEDLPPASQSLSASQCFSMGEN